jgi:hypothetical protein
MDGRKVNDFHEESARFGNGVLGGDRRIVALKGQLRGGSEFELVVERNRLEDGTNWVVFAVINWPYRKE